MNDETKRSRMRAGMIGAAVGVAAIGAIVVIATNKGDEEEERASSVESKRDELFPRVDPNVDPGVLAEATPNWEREPRNAKEPWKQDPADARLKALEEARTNGILGSTALTQGGAFASLTGTGGVSGFDDTNIYGGLLGNEAGEMRGGFGRRGFGPGGGGTGWGTIGTGRYGTIGRGGATGSGYGVGGGRRGGRKGPVVAMASPITSSAGGDASLDRAIVRRYLKRNFGKLTYCYEKELLAKPALAGSITARFTILDTGRASGAIAKGVDLEVARCMSSVMNAIEFPKPKGTGSVTVRVTLAVRPK